MSDTAKSSPDASDSENGLLVDSVLVSALDETSVSFGLNKTGEQGSGYHTRNDPSNPLQRDTAIGRRGIIQVQLKSREIIHGGLTPGGENATLLIYDFHIDTSKRARRVRQATLEFEFRSSVPGVRAPLVHAIAPEGRNTVLSSTQEESLTRGGELTAGVSQFVEVSATVKLEKTVTKTTNDAAAVKGFLFSDDYGNPVGASWNLVENVARESGIPTFFRCAILLNRRFDEDNFECKIKVKAEADWKSEMGRLFGSTPKDDPVLFDPTLPPTNKLRKDGYDMENLGELNLDDFVQIVFSRSHGTGQEDVKK